MNTPRKISILFVCMGNICRSPTAEGVFRLRAQAAGLLDMVEIDSAGTDAWHAGEPPDARSQAHAARRGYDLSMQRARQVQSEDFARFDYLLAMDRDNLARLEAICPPQQRGKLALFMRFARNSDAQVVPDPYYDGHAGFERVLDYIEDATDGLIDLLRAEIAGDNRDNRAAGGIIPA